MSDPICIVRVGTESYKRGDVYFHGRTLRVMKKSTNYDLLSDEVDAVGVHEALGGIINLHSVEDGLYVVGVTNISHDWESGVIDGWELKLFLYIPEEVK